MRAAVKHLPSSCVIIVTTVEMFVGGISILFFCSVNFFVSSFTVLLHLPFNAIPETGRPEDQKLDGIRLDHLAISRNIITRAWISECDFLINKMP